jgi:putative serine protease PepD
VPDAATDLEQTVQTVIQRVQPSVVEVQSSGSQGQSIGSGEVIAADGYIVTNDHVVRGFQHFDVVLATGQTLPATLVGEAPGDDLAVLKVSATGLRPINFGDSNAVRVGTFVLAIGSPLGLDQSATFGIVSAVNRSASEAPARLQRGQREC